MNQKTNMNSASCKCSGLTPLLSGLGLLLMITTGSNSDSRNANLELSVEIEKAIANIVALEWPAGLTNVSVASWEYRSAFEGSHTRILLKKMQTDDNGVSNLLQVLKTNNAQIFEHSPIKDAGAQKHADWWNPEQAGLCDAFKLVRSKGTQTAVLTGLIPKTGMTNKQIFLHLVLINK